LKAAAGYKLVSLCRHRALPPIACAAIALLWTAPASATPLPSDIPTSSPAMSNPRASAESLGISLWSFVHPDSSERDESPADVPPSTSRPATSCWMAAPAEERGLERSSSSGDSNEITVNQYDGRSLPLFNGGTRAVRNSPGAPRATRTNSESQCAAQAGTVDSIRPIGNYLIRKDSPCAELISPPGLFRPPRGGSA
jgi:hypothetical protein